MEIKMSIYNNLSQLNKDIEILEAYGKLKSASILHDKFIRVAQEFDPAKITTMVDQYKNDPPAEILDEEGKYVSPDAKYSDGEPVFTDDDLETLLTKGKLSKDSRTFTYDNTKKLRPSNIVPESVPQTTTKPTLQPVSIPNEKPFRGKLSGAEEVSVYVRIIKQIKALLKRKNIPAAMKLSSDYRNWFSDQDLNKTFQANVDNLLNTFVDNKNINQPAASMSSVNESVNSQNLTIAPLSKMQGGKVEPISSYPSLPPSANMSSVDESVNSQNPTIAPLSGIQDSKVEPIPSSPTSPQSNKTDDYFTMANIEKILKSDSKNKFREASTIFDTLYREIPKPSTPKYMGEEENPEYQEALKKWEKATDALAGQYQSLIKKYRKNLRLVDKKDDVYAKSTPEQAKISALWQAKYNKIYNSKFPRMKKYQELKKIHEIVQRLWQNGKISKAALETFNDMKLKTNNLNSLYPLPGDPGFVPEII
jgi:hypothetical protein